MVPEPDILKDPERDPVPLGVKEIEPAGERVPEIVELTVPLAVTEGDVEFL
jgi:hypothetical protein